MVAAKNALHKHKKKMGTLVRQSGTKMPYNRECVNLLLQKAYHQNLQDAHNTHSYSL